MATATATNEYLDRYKARETFTGEDGRVYKLRELRPAEIFKLRDIFAGSDDATFNAYTIIGAICEIQGDGDAISVAFPRKRSDLEPLMNCVGITPLFGPAAKAFKKLNGGDAKDADAADEAAEADAA